ncbi:MAG: Ppx/GppA family phosphatase [Campylobacterales bacterium]|nr:Ppx/GppA family phosphatase [Campylobacterales bacterium]
MAKVTTIIDIGSNSMRMVVLEKSSRFAFHLINETKAKVKISEGTYENQGNLQELPMKRTFSALKSFLSISSALKARKIICVATSALRDAPNSNVFLNKVKNELGINIKIIDGEKEAYYGALAASNLLSLSDFITVDIGGGSTEFSIVKDKKIIHCLSLKMGTVRMSELYFKDNKIDEAREYILEELKKLKSCGFEIPSTVVGIGGTIRTLSKKIMKKQHYSLDVIHGFDYIVEDKEYVFDKVLAASDKCALKEMGIKKDRFDTIKEGTFIFKTILKELDTKNVVSSGAGVREGVYLHDLLRNSNFKFPSNYNVSVRSLLDRFNVNPKQSAYLGSNARKIFDALSDEHNLDIKYRKLLVLASKLHSIGILLNFYKSNDTAYDVILSSLNYDITHEERVTIAFLIKFSKKSLIKEKDMYEFEELLPSLETMKYLSFMISLNLTINQDFSCPKVEYKTKDNKLKLEFEEDIFLIQNEIEKIETPNELKVKIQNNIKA